MKQVLKIWGLAAALLSLAASCSKGQDATTSEPNTPDTPTETSGEAAPVIARLSMETTLPEHDLRVRIQKTVSNGYAVDIEGLAAIYGGKVPLSCIIRSDDPSQPVTYTTIFFTLEDGNTLRIGGQPVTLEPGTDFTNAGGRKWYIMGWLGQDMKSDKRLYTGIDLHNYGNGHESTSINITPLMFPWKEIKIGTEGGITLGNARRVNMKLCGAFIKVTVTNKTGSSFYTGASGIRTNAYTSEGSYNLDVTPIEGAFPEWTPGVTPDSEGFYNEGLIFTNMFGLSSAEVYENFIWVMPVPTPPANPQTKVIIADNMYKLTFVTNKPVRTTMLQEGKVYTLNIDVYRPMMGLDYMAEYDLLNGSETTPGTFATTHYNRQPGSLYQLTKNNKPNANILCPPGWHTPKRWEWLEAVAANGMYTDYDTKRLGSTEHTLHYTKLIGVGNANYFLRYTGNPMNSSATVNNLREAQRTRMIDNPDGGTLGTGEKMLEITSRYLGSSFTGTVNDLVNMGEDWWSDPNYTVRRVLSAGHYPSYSGPPVGNSGHYYSMKDGAFENGYLWSGWSGSISLYPATPESEYIRPFKDR